jgi:hypothetical protein
VDALCREAQKLDARIVERITLTDLDHQPIGVAVGLVFVVGVAAGQDHVIAMANALAVSRTRAALLVPLWLGAIGRTDSLVEKFVKLLPSPVADALEAAVDEGPPLSRGMLDEFGDIRVVEAITSRFPGLFEPKAAKSAE